MKIASYVVQPVRVKYNESVSGRHAVLPSVTSDSRKRELQL
jgi:hypothetical protein